MAEAYTVTSMERIFTSLADSDYRPWWAYYTDYRGHTRALYVVGMDELAAFVDAMKQLKRLQKRADKRRAKKEQTS